MEGQDEVAEDGVLVINKDNRSQSHFPDFLHHGILCRSIHPSRFKFEDPGARANRELLTTFPENGSQTLKKITPKFGAGCA